MKRTTLALLPAVLALGCAQMPFGMSGLGGWTTLIDGEKGLENFTRVGDANWRAQDGAIAADTGKGGFLLSKESYKDFELRIEFWADPTANSGIYMRCSEPAKLNDKSCYEANIFDQRPDQTYATGARGVEFLMGYYPILDRAPKGRDEDGSFQLWIRRHDEYDQN